MGRDRLPDRFAEWQAQIDDTERDARVDDLLARVPRGADVLELGCGAGGPTTQRLAAHGRLTRRRHLRRAARRARERIPGATFIHGDAATAVELPEGGFDAVVSLYALNNLPRRGARRVFRSHPRLAAARRALPSDRLPPPTCPAWQGDWLGRRHVLQRLGRRHDPAACRRGRPRGRRPPGRVDAGAARARSAGSGCSLAADERRPAAAAEVDHGAGEGEQDEREGGDDERTSGACAQDALGARSFR